MLWFEFSLNTYIYEKVKELKNYLNKLQIKKDIISEQCFKHFQNIATKLENLSEIFMSLNLNLQCDDPKWLFYVVQFQQKYFQEYVWHHFFLDQVFE